MLGAPGDGAPVLTWEMGMKKKKSKKLVLSKETLKNLEVDKLRDVLGAACPSENINQRSCATTR